MARGIHLSPHGPRKALVTYVFRLLPCTLAVQPNCPLLRHIVLHCKHIVLGLRHIVLGLRHIVAALQPTALWLHCGPIVPALQHNVPPLRRILGTFEHNALQTEGYLF